MIRAFLGKIYRGMFHMRYFILAVILIAGGIAAISWTQYPDQADAACSPCQCESCNVDPACDFCEEAGKEAIKAIKEIADNGYQDALFLMFLNIWIENVSPALLKMAEQITAFYFSSASMMGFYIDASNQLNADLALNLAQRDAVLDYQPSAALCVFGTSRQGLASSEQQKTANLYAFSQGSLNRHLGTRDAALGTNPLHLDPNGDKRDRWLQFINKYCDRGEQGGLYQYVCANNAPEYANKDIDVTKTLFAKQSLDINMGDSRLSGDEQDIIALANNIYGNKIFQRPGLSAFGKSSEASQSNKRNYHQFRSLIAKKNVAENSFYAIAAAKSTGNSLSTPYMRQILAEMGIGDDEFNQILGNNPSYDAQMEVLTKKIYQNPSFITSLIDKPANIGRQHAALLSFELMQERDSLLSMQRQEILMALMLDKILEKSFNRANSNLR